jgi:hypothetical protein
VRPNHPAEAQAVARALLELAGHGPNATRHDSDADQAGIYGNPLQDVRRADAARRPAAGRGGRPDAARRRRFARRLAPDRGLIPQRPARSQSTSRNASYSIVCGNELVGLSRLPSNFAGAGLGEVSNYLSEIAFVAFWADHNDRRAVMFETRAAYQW